MKLPIEGLRSKSWTSSRNPARRRIDFSCSPFVITPQVKCARYGLVIR